MIEIVFDDTFAGLMKIVDFGEEEIGEIVSLYMELDLGSLRRGALSKFRMRQVSSWFTLNPNLGEGLFYAPDVEALKPVVEDVRNRIISGEKARIWYDHSAHSVCGLYFFVSLLPLTDLDISVICLQEHSLGQKCWSLCFFNDIERMPELLSVERALSVEERQGMCNRWEELSKTNYPLRVYLNGKLLGVPEDFYDNYITSLIPEERPFKVMQLLRSVTKAEILFYDIAEWRIAAVLEKEQLKYGIDYDDPFPIKAKWQS